MLEIFYHYHTLNPVLSGNVDPDPKSFLTLKISEGIYFSINLQFDLKIYFKHVLLLFTFLFEIVLTEHCVV